MQVLRVFPRKTKATPVDDMSRIGYPGLFDTPVDEVHISVTFSFDIPEAELLFKAWQGYGEVKIGGPALGDPGGDFVSGKYLKPGYTITSRGCNNTCWYCDAWRRDGTIRELPIVEGHHILDDNLLQCSEDHIRAVFDMLKKQNERVMIGGGLESRLFEPWHVAEIAEINPKQVFFANDKPGDLAPLVKAGEMFRAGGWPETPGKADRLRCYVLAGYKGDTMAAAEERLKQTVKAGFFPFLMLYLNKKGRTPPGWTDLQRRWTRPALMRKTITQERSLSHATD